MRPSVLIVFVLLACAFSLLPAGEVVLSVGATSPGARVLTYAWAVGAAPGGAALPVINQVGPAPATGFTDTAIATFPATATPGDYVLRVTIYDGLSSVTSDTTVRVRRAQSLSFHPFGEYTLAEADFAPDAIASSGLTVSYGSSDPTVATIIDGQIHLVGPGTVTITASQPGNGTYAPATIATQVLTVRKRSQTIAFPPLPTTVKVGDPDLLPGATASSGLPIGYASSNPAAAIIVAGRIHIVGAGSTLITAAQGGDATWASAESIGMSLQVAAALPPVITRAAAAVPDILVLP
jgi:hypothetical protein